MALSLADLTHVIRAEVPVRFDPVGEASALVTVTRLHIAPPCSDPPTASAHVGVRLMLHRRMTSTNQSVSL